MTDQNPAMPDEIRQEFEKWYTNGDKSCPSIRRNAKGFYHLMQAACAWDAWVGAWNALSTTLPPLDAEKAEALAEFTLTTFDCEDRDSGEIIRTLIKDMVSFKTADVITRALSSPQTPGKDAQNSIKEILNRPTPRYRERRIGDLTIVEKYTSKVTPPLTDPRDEAMGMIVEALEYAFPFVKACRVSSEYDGDFGEIYCGEWCGECKRHVDEKDNMKGHAEDCKVVGISKALSHPAVKPFIEGE